LFAALFPAVDRYLEQHPGGLVEQLVLQGLRNTDTRVAEDKPVTPTFLFSLLLYGPIAAAIEALPPERWHEPRAILEACDRALRETQQRVSIPRRVALGVREMYALQPRLEGPRGRRALRLLEQPRFRAAFDLLALRGALGLAVPEIAQWWTALQAASPDEREQMVAAAPSARGGAASGAGSGTGPASPRRRRRRRSRGGA
jgi:poly(A) polymerase